VVWAACYLGCAADDDECQRHADSSTAREHPLLRGVRLRRDRMHERVQRLQTSVRAATSKAWIRLQRVYDGFLLRRVHRLGTSVAGMAYISCIQRLLGQGRLQNPMHRRLAGGVVLNQLPTLAGIRAAPMRAPAKGRRRRA